VSEEEFKIRLIAVSRHRLSCVLLSRPPALSDAFVVDFSPFLHSFPIDLISRHIDPSLDEQVGRSRQHLRGALLAQQRERSRTNVASSDGLRSFSPFFLSPPHHTVLSHLNKSNTLNEQLNGLSIFVHSQQTKTSHA
jgi:hypothetical protein